MVQLAALAVQPSTFDPVRATLAGASLMNSRIQNATALENLRTAPERMALALEQARRQNALAELQLGAARRDQGALADFQSRGGLGNPQALQSLVGNPQMFGSALQGYTNYANWRNTQNAQGAHRVLIAGPEGSPTRAQAWRQELERALAEQRIDQGMFAQLSARDPDDATLQRLIDMARPPGSEPTLQEILRTGLPGGPPPGGGQGRTMPSFAGLSPEVAALRARAGIDQPPETGAQMDLPPSYLFGLRDQMGITPPADVQAGAAEIARLRAEMDAASAPGGPPPAPVVAPAPERTLDAPMFQGSPFLRGHAPPPSVPGLLASLGLTGIPGAGSDADPQGAPAPPSTAPKGSRDNPFTAREIEAGADRNQTGTSPDGVTYFRYPDGRLGTIRRNPDGTEAVAPVDDGTAVYGWQGAEGGQTVPVSGPPSVPGVTLGQPADGVGTPGANLLGGAAGGPPPPAPGRPENVGQVIGRVLGSATPAQRARFWTLMSRSSTRDDAMKLLQEIESGGTPLTSTQRMEREAGLRTELRTISKPYLDMGDSLARIEASDATPEGDLALIYNYMRMLDPGSVVREGEFAMLGRSGGLPQQVQQYFNRLSGHGQLTPQMRTAVKAQSRSLFQAQEQRHLGIQRQYGEIARRLGLNPDNILLDFGQQGLSAEHRQLLTDARQAIESGRDAAAVRARLQEMGVDPALLDR